MSIHIFKAMFMLLSYTNIVIYNIGYITIKKIDDYENINNVNPWYLITGNGDGYIKENNESMYLVLLLEMVIKKYYQNLQNFRMKLSILLRQEMK